MNGIFCLKGCFKRAAVPACLAVVIALAACRKSRTPGVQLNATGATTQILKNFQMQEIVSGVRNMVVESVEGRMAEAQQVADVDKPRVTFFKRGAASSVLTAPQGRVHLDSHEVLAWGGVTVVTPDSATLTTDRLRYDPQTQHLVSDDPVRLEKPDSITLGVGLDATSDLSRVRIGRQKVYVKAMPKK